MQAIANCYSHVFANDKQIAHQNLQFIPLSFGISFAVFPSKVVVSLGTFSCRALFFFEGVRSFLRAVVTIGKKKSAFEI